MNRGRPRHSPTQGAPQRRDRCRATAGMPRQRTTSRDTPAARRAANPRSWGMQDRRPRRRGTGCRGSRCPPSPSGAATRVAWRSQTARAPPRRLHRGGDRHSTMRPVRRRVAAPGAPHDRTSEARTSEAPGRPRRGPPSRRGWRSAPPSLPRQRRWSLGRRPRAVGGSRPWRPRGGSAAQGRPWPARCLPRNPTPGPSRPRFPQPTERALPGSGVGTPRTPPQHGKSGRPRLAPRG